MKNLLLLTLVSFMLASCGLTSSLYYWGGMQRGTTTYENLTYTSYHNQTPESTCKLICMYEEMVSNPAGIRRVPPPGICAEYGYMLLSQGNAQIFSEHATSAQKRVFDTSDFESRFQERGKEMLEMEMQLYPESVKFIAPLMKKLCK